MKPKVDPRPMDVQLFHYCKSQAEKLRDSDQLKGAFRSIAVTAGKVADCAGYYVKLVCVSNTVNPDTQINAQYMIDFIVDSSDDSVIVTIGDDVKRLMDQYERERDDFTRPPIYQQEAVFTKEEVKQKFEEFQSFLFAELL